ncbi:type-F conjugative transfer system protein TraW [Acinetobacter sp. P1(2025)]|uniref:type-F conjugative transfer system protein TraW n=1 Tax=Acinetobacter sp. P1(2025) TaxID=3446120 RepID=UPI003F52A122
MKASLFKFVCILLVALSSVVHAKNFGTFGETYPVKEVSFIEAIQKKMQALVDNGEWDKYRKEYTEKTLDGLKRPKGTQLPHVLTTQTRYVDPSIILEMDIKLPDGKYLARRGDRINPLKQSNMSRPIAFIDGDEPKQVAWALAEHKKNPRVTIMLVNGSWYELSVKNKTKFWFDQTGEFINRFDIKRTPSLVTQDGLRLRVDEVAY